MWLLLVHISKRVPWLFHTIWWIGHLYYLNQWRLIYDKHAVIYILTSQSGPGPYHISIYLFVKLIFEMLKCQLYMGNSVHFQLINGCSLESVKVAETETLGPIYMYIYIYIHIYTYTYTGSELGHHYYMPTNAWCACPSAGTMATKLHLSLSNSL